MTIRDVARRLPGILQLRDCSQALAMLDAILCPERWLRYQSFDTHWGPDQELDLTTIEASSAAGLGS
jgi:hypothetical protein